MSPIFQKSFTVLRKAFDYWTQMRSPRRAAALSYYAIFSLGPLLLIITYIAQQTSRAITVDSTLNTVGVLVNPAIFPAIQNMLISLNGVVFSPTLIVIGILLFIIGAIAVLRELQHSISEMLEPHKEHVGVKQMTARYIIGFIVLVIFCSFIAIATSTHIFSSSSVFSSLSHRLIQTVFIFVATLVMTTIFYQIASDQKTSWRSIGIGALITATLFTLGQLFISYFIAHLSASLSAASSFVILAAWIYYSGLVFFFGVAITYILQARKKALPLQNH